MRGNETEAYSKQDADDKRTKINRSSVISLFKFSLFVSIHKSMSLAQSSVVDLQIDKYSANDVSKDKYNWVSLAQK